MSAAQYRPLIVAYRNGSPVRLDELGQRDRQRRGRQDRVLVLHQAKAPQRAIILGVQRQPGTNTIAGDRRGEEPAAHVPLPRFPPR